jgi:hypothetical protein
MHYDLSSEVLKSADIFKMIGLLSDVLHQRLIKNMLLGSKTPSLPITQNNSSSD